MICGRGKVGHGSNHLQEIIPVNTLFSCFTLFVIKYIHLKKSTFNFNKRLGKEGRWNRLISSTERPPRSSRNSRAMVLWRGGLRITRVFASDLLLFILFWFLRIVLLLFVVGNSQVKIRFGSFESASLDNNVNSYQYILYLEYGLLENFWYRSKKDF